MAWSQTSFVSSFDAEVGSALSGLATTDQKTLWYNEGQARLDKWLPAYDDIVWAAADREVNLNADFIELQKIIYDDGVQHQAWRVFGKTLVIDREEGATEAGSARVWYHAEWPAMTGAVSSSTPASMDYACLYYALHRFWKLLSSNRMYYKRYATLVGANAVTSSDLQQEADRYLQDFFDARADVHPVTPAFFYEG
jgi:hypothetical protein